MTHTRVAERRHAVILDTVGLGAPPGTVQAPGKPETAQQPARNIATAHEGSGLEARDPVTRHGNRAGGI